MISAARVTWGEIAPHVTQSLQGEEEFFSKEIETGKSQAWKFKNKNLWMITRSEGVELVICCIEGQGLKDVASGIIEAAKSSGFESIRFHTKRPALGRMLESYGFKEQERIFNMGL